MCLLATSLIQFEYTCSWKVYCISRQTCTSMDFYRNPEIMQSSKNCLAWKINLQKICLLFEYCGSRVFLEVRYFLTMSKISISLILQFRNQRIPKEMRKGYLRVQQACPSPISIIIVSYRIRLEPQSPAQMAVIVHNKPLNFRTVLRVPWTKMMGKKQAGRSTRNRRLNSKFERLARANNKINSEIELKIKQKS